MSLVTDTNSRANPQAIADEAVLIAYPLPWEVIAESSCTRLVAANGATVLACNAEELDIAHCIVRIVNAVATNQASGRNS